MRCYRISAGYAPHQRNPKPAENRTLCRARALGKRVSVFSPRARTPAGGRSRCGFAKQIRGFSAQCPSQISMRCRSGVLPRPQPINGFPKPRRIELCAGRGRKENASVTQSGTRFPNGGPSGKFIPESRLKLGRAFRSISSTPKPMRPPFQNWVEESQNAIAGGQHDCRR